MSSQLRIGTDSKGFGKWDRAQRLVEGEGVLLHRFLPSGLEIWTVIGRGCEYLVDLPVSDLRKPYCACDDFHYRVLSGKSEDCYHLVAVKNAIAEERYAVMELQDSDFLSFAKKLMSSIFVNIS